MKLKGILNSIRLCTHCMSHLLTQTYTENGAFAIIGESQRVLNLSGFSKY